MAFRFETEEEHEELTSRRSRNSGGRAAASDAEIALGTRSLVAIFFGLVLICAVFFGLGYSVGRGSGTRAVEPSAAETAAAAPDSHLPKPSPDQTLTPIETQPSNATGSDASATDRPDGEQQTSPAPATVRTPSTTSIVAASNPFQSPTQVPATASGAKSATLQPAAATLAASFMVQVAAVRVPQDAQILVDALKKHGYMAAVRNEPQDQLLHIQLGPFPARSDATAMRAKLLSDGYNAVVK